MTFTYLQVMMQVYFLFKNKTNAKSFDIFKLFSLIIMSFDYFLNSLDFFLNGQLQMFMITV